MFYAGRFITYLIRYADVHTYEWNTPKVNRIGLDNLVNTEINRLLN